jgi:hypothetical protein
MITRRADGFWVIKCPECAKDRAATPIGIDMPLESLQTAELLRTNHVGHQVQRPSRMSA